MPIGKNAIKRVANNGYSNVKTSAPDMENSVVEEKKSGAKKTPAKNPAPKAVTSGKKSSAVKSTKNPAPKAVTAIEESKKTSEKKADAPKMASKPKSKPAPKTEIKKSLEKEPDFSPVNTAKKLTESEEKRGTGYVNLGGELPVYLL